jgi:branched-chain amino acid transport system permease protein
MKSQWLKWGKIIGLFLLLFALPSLITDRYFQHIMVLSCIFVILASSWNLLAGYAGLLNLGHAAFFGIGAYSSALLTIHTGISPWLGLFAGAAVSAVFGIGLGVPAFRLRGPYLAITTIGFSEIIRLVSMNWVDLTRGSLGLSEIPPLTPIQPWQGFKIEFVSERNAYYVLLVAVILTLFLVKKLVKSEFGLTLESMREEEDGAESIGINTSQYKLAVFMISAALAGFAGGLYAHYVRLLSPENLGLHETFTILTMVAVGGIGTFVGPIIGAVFLTALSEGLRFFEEAIHLEIRMVIYGALLMATVMFMRKGLVGIYQTIFSSRQAGRERW